MSDQLALDGMPASPPPAPRRPYDHAWSKVRTTILERDDHTCHWCGSLATTVDHVDALAHGGSRLDPANLVAACRTCNSRRGAELANRRRQLGRLSRDW